MPETRSFGGEFVSWLVSAMTPMSAATKTAATQRHDVVGRCARSHTTTAAPAQKRRAMSTASRTVLAMAGLMDTPANVCTTPAGEASVHTPRAATQPEGHQPHDPLVARHGVTGVRSLGAIDPAGEEDARRGGHGDHVAALQPLMAVERQAVEEMLQRRVGAERQQVAEQSRPCTRSVGHAARSGWASADGAA